MAEGKTESSAGAAGPVESAKETLEPVELSRSRQASARRVAESRATIPHLYLSAEARIEPAGGGIEPALVRACALALGEAPELNGAYRDGKLERHGRVNVGVAVETPDGLALATVFDADRKQPATIAEELAALGERARAGSLTRADTAGVTFSIYALAGSSTVSVWPTIPPGQAAALAAGAARDGGVLGLVLACDERLVEIPAAAAFLDRIVALAGDPSGL